MFHLNEFNEINRRFTTIEFREDDKEVQARCFAQIHQFAPASKDCVCGRYADYQVLLTEIRKEEADGKSAMEDKPSSVPNANPTPVLRPIAEPLARPEFGKAEVKVEDKGKQPNPPNPIPAPVHTPLPASVPRLEMSKPFIPEAKAEVKPDTSIITGSTPSKLPGKIEKK